MTLEPIVDESLPPEYGWGFVTARVIQAVADTTADADRDPQARPASGKVRFIPTETKRRVTTAPHKAFVAHTTFEAKLNARGQLVDAEGQPGIALLEGEWTADFRLSGGLAIPRFAFHVGPEHTPESPLDLVDVAPYDPPSHVTMQSLLVPSGGREGDVLTLGTGGRLAWVAQAGGGGGGVDVGQVVEDYLDAAVPPAVDAAVAPHIAQVQEISGLTGEDAAVATLLGDRDSAAHGAVLAIAEPQGEVDPRTAVIQVGGNVTMPPTPYDHSHYVHPSVVHVPGGWNGYPYWMAVTPLASNNQEENPCIYASTDGDTWVEPSGIVNPITASPGTPAYNADTELVLHNGTMYCFYTTNWVVENNVSVYRCSYKTSTDGVTWSAQQTAYSYDRTLRRFQTPTIRVRDGVWHVFAVDEVTKKIVHMQGTSAAGPWSEPIYGTLSTPLPAGRDVWHITVDWTGSEWHLLLNDTGVGMSGSSGSLFFYRSMDEGRNWSGGQKALHHIGPDWNQIYRSAWVATRTGGRLSYDVWLNVFHTGPGISRKLKRGHLVFGAEPLQAMHERDMQAARMGYPPVLAYDDWNRPDGSLGNAPTGQEWVPVLAGSAGSVSGRLARFTAPSMYVVDSGKADVFVEVDLREMSTAPFCGVVVRNNGAAGTYVYFGWVGSLKFMVMNGGSPAADVATPNVVGALTPGDTPIRLGVRAKGDKIIRYVNGIQLGDPYTIPPQYTALLSGTHHGFGLPYATVPAAMAIGDVLIRSL